MLKKLFKPKCLLVVTLVSLIMVIIAISCRMMIKGAQPTFFQKYNYQLFVMLVLMVAFACITAFFISLKLKEWHTVGLLLIAYPLVFYITLFIGHSLIKPANQYYYKSNKEVFSKLFSLVKSNNVCFKI